MKTQIPENMANNTKNKKYEDFMKYMEDIEEEISGQCDRSAQRRQKDKDELDDILSTSNAGRQDDKQELLQPFRDE